MLVFPKLSILINSDKLENFTIENIKFEHINGNIFISNCDERINDGRVIHHTFENIHDDFIDKTSENNTFEFQHDTLIDELGEWPVIKKYKNKKLIKIFKLNGDNIFYENDILNNIEYYYEYERKKLIVERFKDCEIKKYSIRIFDFSF